jgi:hypothetical protein
MSKMKLDPKKMEVVKKTVTVAAPTGGIKLSAYDKAAGTKFLKGGTTDKAAQNAVGTMMAGRAAAVQGQGGQTMGGKATAAQGKGGPTMGQKAAIARGQGGPVAQAIANKLTGKPAASAAAPQEKQEQGTYRLPGVVVVNGQNYNTKDIFRAHENLVKTYGKNSYEAKALRAAAGMRIHPEYGIIMGVQQTLKPDMRGNTKSYVDTIQNVSGSDYANAQRRLEEEDKEPSGSYGGYGENIHKTAAKLLGVLNIKPGARNLKEDPNARVKDAFFQQ